MKSASIATTASAHKCPVCDGDGFVLLATDLVNLGVSIQRCDNCTDVSDDAAASHVYAIAKEAMSLDIARIEVVVEEWRKFCNSNPPPSEED